MPKQTAKEAIWPVTQLFVLSASILITIFLLKAASDFIVPFLIAVAIAVILAPLFTWLESKRIPKGVSLLAVIVISLIPVILVGGYVAEEAAAFSANYQNIKASFTQSLQHFFAGLSQYGIVVDEAKVDLILQKSNVSAVLRKLAAQANEQFSNFLLIFFMVAFMLMESAHFYNKMEKIAQTYRLDGTVLQELLDKVKSYFSIKVKTSLLTALWVLAILWFYEVPYYYLWAVLAFALNFIPVIGSILAAIPAVAFALVSHGIGTALWVALWYVAVNMVVGNILEPKIMGKGLGLSALVIFLSMTFWGWVFGPAGMILSVPLTMIVQYLFDHYEQTRWIALLLSDYETNTTQGGTDAKNDNETGA